MFKRNVEILYNIWCASVRMCDQDRESKRKKQNENIHINMNKASTCRSTILVLGWRIINHHTKKPPGDKKKSKLSWNALALSFQILDMWFNIKENLEQTIFNCKDNGNDNNKIKTLATSIKIPNQSIQVANEYDWIVKKNKHIKWDKNNNEYYSSYCVVMELAKKEIYTI